MGKKKSRRRSFLNTSTIFKFVRLTALLSPAAGAIIEEGTGAWDTICARYTGYSPKWNQFRWEWLAQGWMPYVMSVLVTNGIQKLSGIIRRL